MTRPRLTRIQRIVGEYFMPYNGTIDEDDLNYVMEFLKVMLMKKGKYVPFEESMK